MMYRAPQPAITVLIAEDEVLVRLDAADGLVERGFDVVEAASATQALSLLEAGARIDVLFTDINMPGDLDGIALAQRVRARWPHVAIVITSAQPRPDIDHSLGRFVPKPYVPDAVAQTIRTMVYQRASLPCPAE